MLYHCRMDRVLEVGGYAAGFCGRLFAQCGAEVARVEAAPAAPAWVGDEAMDPHLHGGKRRLQTEDAGLIAEFADRADVEWRMARCAARASSTSRTSRPGRSPPASSPISGPAW